VITPTTPGASSFPWRSIGGSPSSTSTAEPTVELTSDAQDDRVSIELPVTGQPRDLAVGWGTYVAAVARELRAQLGLSGHVSSTIPAGAGLSSSAALECAVGLALGFQGTPEELALMARRAEHAATGVPTGIMDQLCIAAAVEGHATLIDCHTLDVTQVPVPEEVDVVVVLFVAHRTLVGSAYADRVAECARAEDALGPLRLATLDDVAAVDLDDVARRRSRHVVSENQRVREFADALERADYTTAGAIMSASHRSLAVDFETSTAAMDDAVADLAARPGVFGARMTGGGFGGCVVALCEPGVLADGWLVHASAGARRCEPT
jgi:galactokinase